MPTAKRSTRTLLFIAAWVVALAYAWTYLDRGWVPHDEGTLAFSAERVMDGMVPHLDYDEVYTGGLAFAGAAAFKVFGVDLFTLRLLLFALFALWIPVVYWSARRFATPSLSVVVTLLAGAWSIPAYSAAIPSWFNLFFAGFAVACLLRHLETSGRRWLVAAGIAAGVSILVKVVGLYLVAGCLLALAFFEQAAPRRDLEPRESSGRLYSGLVTAAGIALSLLVWSVVRQVAEPVVFLHFVLPAALLSGWLAVTEWRRPPSIARVRVGALAGLVLPFLVGVAIPLVVFAIPYALRGGLGDLYQGVFVDPLQRVAFARRRPPQLTTMLNIVPVLAVLGMSWRLPASRRLRIAGFLAVLCGLLLFFGSNWRVYPRVWFSMRSLIPVVTLCGIAVLWAAARSKGAGGAVPPSPSARAPGLRELQLFTFLSVTGLAGLVQFPFTAPIYFLYVAPLAALTVLAVVAAADRTALLEGSRPMTPRQVGMRSRPVFGVVLIFYLGFAVFWIHPGFIYNMGTSFLRDDQTAALDLERASLHVSSQDKRDYEALVGEIVRRARTDFVLATPDAPEIYFLTGLSSPTRTTFELFAEEDFRGERILSALDSTGVSVIALNEEPAFSSEVSEELRAELVARYPHQEKIGRFVIMWRETQ